MSNALEGFNDNVVVLRSVYGKVGQKYYIQPCKDPKTGRLPDCVRPVNSQGDIICTDEERNSRKYFIKENETFIIEDGTTFDLTNEIDRKNWEAIKYCNLIAPERFAKDAAGNLLIDGTMGWNSKNPRYGVAELYVDRPGLEAATRNTKRQLITKACNYIFNDEKGKDGLILRAKLLGKHMENMPSADIEDYLLSIAEKDPERIISTYAGSDLTLRILLIDAKEKKVITVKNGIYIYSGSENLVLGANDNAVLTWMKNPNNIKALKLIRQDTYPELYVVSEIQPTIESEEVDSKSKHTNKK